MINIKRRPPVATGVELAVQGFNLFAKSESKNRWIQCDDGWFLAAEGVNPYDVYVMWENPDDPTANKFTPMQWAETPEWLKALLMKKGIRKVVHNPTCLSSHATIRNGAFHLENFRWVDGRCYADIYRY